VYFAVNAPPGIVGTTPAAAVATISSWGFPVSAADMAGLAREAGEKTLFARTGGAPSLALGMARIFAPEGSGQAMVAFWYHFAIMFEALFILTIIDSGTRVGRFLLQDALGQAWKPLGRTAWMPGVMVTSAAMVAAWGYFLVQGVLDPLGGINSLWPLFGISNQLLAAVALCVGTTILLKMHGLKYVWITGAPLAWVVMTTFTAGWQKVFSAQPAIGFLAQAAQLEMSLRAGTAGDAAAARSLIFNARLDAVVCGILMLLVAAILADSMRCWVGILNGSRDARVHESPFVVSDLRTEAL
jgi:carbon starvation protein